MADTILAIAVSTPMGDAEGTARLRIDGASLSGSITLMNQDASFSGGTIDADGNLKFTGSLDTPMGAAPYTVTGTLVNGKLTATAETGMGKFAIRSK
ncbi:MAG: hypothetical protein LBT36_02735 [Oscillospiraceae bacterium]|jgi:hypothetical protein|nr:hypothetical protein [Oscillospiraceae bacterium]